MKTPEIEILFEDNHLLAVVKPVNMPVQGDTSGDLDLLQLLKQDLKTRYQKPGNVFVGMVHRLDRPVGGVMVFAKTSKAAARLSEQIRTREFQKSYYAVTRGTPQPTSGCLTHYLWKDERTNTVKIVDATFPGAKEAVLDYRVAALQGNMSQNQRQQAIDGFRDGKYDILAATDVAARGIDVAEISHVINFDIPDTTDAYTHRIGRTGRAQQSGEAFTFATLDDEATVREIERVLGSKIERRRLDGFDYGDFQPQLASPEPPARKGRSRRSNGRSGQRRRAQTVH